MPQITDAGASLAVISPQVARTPRETEEPKAFAYEMLRDFGNRAAESYGLVFTLPDDLRQIYTSSASISRAVMGTAPGVFRSRPAS